MKIIGSRKSERDMYIERVRAEVSKLSDGDHFKNNALVTFSM